MLLLVGLGAAAELAFTERSEQQAHMRAMRDRLAAGLLAVFPRDIVQVNGPSDPSLVLPNTLSISIKGLAAPSLLQMLQVSPDGVHLSRVGVVGGGWRWGWEF